MAPNLSGRSSQVMEEVSIAPLTIIEGKPGLQQSPHYDSHAKKNQKPSNQPQYKWSIVWRNVIAFIYLHFYGVYGFYLLFFTAQWRTVFWTVGIAALAALGITAGAHRLWAHRTYKAKLPLRIILCVFQTMAFQNHIYEWVRDHRVHHKFTDTDADPHNAKRGFFFSHIGWLMLRKHKDVTIKGKTVDLSDLEADPVVQFQRYTYLLFMPLLCFVMPAVVPWYYWGEPWWTCWYGCSIFRYTASLNGTWLVNSAAHIWGTKPYDNTIGPTENVHVAFWAFGEGWHNYHHVFPWDYKAAELGNYRLNFTTAVLDLLAKIGWAYDLKTASVEMIKKRVKRTGDGSRVFPENSDHHHDDDHVHENCIWGWGDKDMEEEDIKDVKIYNKVE